MEKINIQELTGRVNGELDAARRIGQIALNMAEQYNKAVDKIKELEAETSSGE